MSGIVHESRLTRLLKLRDRLDDEITAARLLEEQRTKRTTAQQAAVKDRQLQEAQTRRDSVPAATVRLWAAKYGHPFPARGRVPDALIDLYLDANRHRSNQ